MPNATVRANARALPEATNRRAILGAVFAAGAAAALPVPAAAASPALSDIDRRVLDLWRRRAKLKAIHDRLWEQWRAQYYKLPDWARCGPKYLRPDGSPAEKEGSAGWPMVADLSRRPVGADGLINARPSPDDLRSESWRSVARGEKVTELELERSLAEHAERCRQQKAEKELLGLNILDKQVDAAANAKDEVDAELGGHIGTSVLALGAVLVMGIIDEDADAEDIPGLYRACLAAIRPQLVGAIAEEADRVLAQEEEA